MFHGGDMAISIHGQTLLSSDFPLPPDRPFTTREAAGLGIGRATLSRLHSEGLIRRMLKGVYAAADLVDTVDTRIAALSLVVPPTAVITDETAAWVHGVDIGAPGDHLRVPPICMFQLAGNTRLRNQLCASGQRAMLPEDLIQIGDLLVATPLRTALDLGRLRPRDRAIGALDALLRLQVFALGDLLDQVERFRGERGVVQLRELAPIADARAESPAESVLRLRWLDTNGLPPPIPQVPILDDAGNELFYLDLGLPEIRYAAEYDGAEWHSSDAAKERDRRRRAWLRDVRSWTIDVFKKDDVFGADQTVQVALRHGIIAARRAMSAPAKSAARRYPDLRRRQLGA